MSSLSKAFERLAKDQISEFISSNRLLSKFQSGFRKFHSTKTALLKITNDIRFNVDHKLVTVLVLLDFSKAFDTVDHSLLCGKLKSYFGFDDTSNALLCSYLSNRSQFVATSSGTVSGHLPVLSGVPQGSVPGPLLFSLFIDGLSDILSSRYHFYADDVQLYSAFPLRERDDGIGLMNRDSDWAKMNMLDLNAK